MMKRLLIANLIIGTFISVQANAATQIDNAPHGNPLSLFSTKDMGGNVKRATYGVKWKDGAMTYTNIELVCGENKARDIGYSDDGTGTVWKDRSNDLYNGKKHYDLVKDSIQSNVYRVVCKSTVTQVALAPVVVQSHTPQTSKAVPEKILTIVEPEMCVGYNDEIESNLKRIAMTDAEGIGDNSAPRATMRQQQITGYKTDIQTTLNLMAAQKCKLPKASPNAAKYYSSAMSCQLKNMSAKNQDERCDMWKEVK